MDQRLFARLIHTQLMHPTLHKINHEDEEDSRQSVGAELQEDAEANDEVLQNGAEAGHEVLQEGAEAGQEGAKPGQAGPGEGFTGGVSMQGLFRGRGRRASAEEVGGRVPEEGSAWCVFNLRAWSSSL